MTCSEIAPLLARIAGCESTPRLSLDAARHLASCAACAERLLRLRDLSGLLDRIPAAEVPASFTERVMRALPKKVKRAGGALVIAFVALSIAAFSFGGAGGSLPAVFLDPSESALTLLSGILVLAQGLLAALSAVLEAAGMPPIRVRGPGASVPASILWLALIATLTLAASGAAFGEGALSLRRERRSARPDVR